MKPSPASAVAVAGAPSSSARGGGGVAAPNPNPKSSPATNSPHLPPPIPSIPPPPIYGFHNLDRRTIMLADGSVRSYFSLPPEFSFEPLVPRFESLLPHHPDPSLNPVLDRRHPPLHDDFRGPPRPPAHPTAGGEAPALHKRKLEEEDQLAWHRQNVLQYGNSNGMASGSGGDRLPRNAEDPRASKQIKIGLDAKDGKEELKNAAQHGNSNGIASGSGGGRNADDSRASKQLKIGGDGKDGSSARARKEENAQAVISEVDKMALKKAFLEYAKKINENLPQKINYIEDGKNGKLQCIACSDRTPRDFRDVHGLLKHAFNCQIAEFRVNHLGLHKALCVLLGLNYLKNPDSKANIILPSDEAQANRKDLIMWPPSVIIHNTSTLRRLDGRTEGFGNKEMDAKLKELGFSGGKARSIYRKEGHTGVTVVRFAGTLDGLKEAERLTEHFEKDDRGRNGWALVQASHSGDDDKNPALVKIDEKTGEKQRIFYGYLGTAFDLDKVDIDIRKKCVIKSRKELDISD